MDIIESEGRRGENMPLRPEVEHQKENGGENTPLRPQNAAPGKLAAPENSPGKTAPEKSLR